MQHASVNDIRIAYGIRGDGPPLLLIMGYRLNSRAWPPDFIEGLARRFKVIIFDNRGTGASDKPTSGYEISNMAGDAAGLLDHLEIPNTHVLGYSMGGAVAQEFTRQFPGRVASLVLCATMAGGASAIYAPPPVIRVMREHEGLTPEDIARQIWKVTYSPGYLEKNRELAEDQMQREIAMPTPLHAADLQFQAFAEFDCSDALADFQIPTLVMTGDLDQLISPRNAGIIAGLVPGARLIVIPGCGHRMMWEATDECVAIVTEFLADSYDGVAAQVPPGVQTLPPYFVDLLTPAIEFLSQWPWMMVGAGVDGMSIARQSIYFGGRAQFGDGKPIILLPETSSVLSFAVLSNWLKAMGYRPYAAEGLADRDATLLSGLIREATQRLGRRAVLVAPDGGWPRALAVAAAHADAVSDIVLLNASPRAGNPPGIRTHFISAWSLHLAMAALPKLLRNIQMELIPTPGSAAPDQACGDPPPPLRAAFDVSRGGPK